jgi:HK97 gp10 family phage protein
MALEFNFYEVEQKFKELGKKLSEEIMEEALFDGADIVLDEMKKEVPKDTGNLLAHLDYKIRQGGSGYVTYRGRKRRSNSKRKGALYKVVDIGIVNDYLREATYGFYQEYGTRSMVGKKWMKKSFEATNKKATNKIAETIKKELSKLNK